MQKPHVVLAAESRRTMEHMNYSGSVLDVIAVPAAFMGRVIRNNLPPIIEGMESFVQKSRRAGSAVVDLTFHR